MDLPSPSRIRSKSVSKKQRSGISNKRKLSESKDDKNQSPKQKKRKLNDDNDVVSKMHAVFKQNRQMKQVIVSLQKQRDEYKRKYLAQKKKIAFYEVYGANTNPASNGKYKNSKNESIETTLPKEQNKKINALDNNLNVKQTLNSDESSSACRKRIFSILQKLSKYKTETEQLMIAQIGKQTNEKHQEYVIKIENEMRRAWKENIQILHEEYPDCVIKCVSEATKQYMQVNPNDIAIKKLFESFIVQQFNEINVNKQHTTNNQEPFKKKTIENNEQCKLIENITSKLKSDETKEKKRGFFGQIKTKNKEKINGKAVKRIRLKLNNVSSSKVNKSIALKASDPKKMLKWEDCHYISVHCKFCNQHFGDIDDYISHLQHEYAMKKDMEWKRCNEGDCDGSKQYALQHFVSHLHIHGYEAPYHCNIKKNGVQCTFSASLKSNLVSHLQRSTTHNIQLQK